MPDAHCNDNTIHINNTFTELFHMLKKVKPLNGSLTIDYRPDEINKMLMHTDNALTNILHGLQTIAGLVTLSSFSDKNDIANIGYFLASIGNLLEALNMLRMDCGEQLFIESQCEDDIVSQEVVAN